MSLSLRDFEDANLEGMAIFEQWRAEWEAEFVAPVAEEAIAALMQSLSPGQREMLRQSDPDALKQLEKRLKVR